ncbi:hypothetical protein [Terrisporobacter muris]|uniref:Uncharacterized protein n=1 Tax=Terrisporobacter muris TaxID=2963284 RepID=A0A9X2M8X7_9FIRM|nr:hypothetical protein [Terrisporobacter muris]MCR1822004.1 hypothetical protein [Terrisporobacter muris]
MAVKNLLIRGGADFSNMHNGLNNAQKKLSNFQRNVNGIMRKVATVFATIKVGELIKNSVQDAMSVETSIENINRTMQNSSKVFEDWIKSQSQAYGMSIQEGYKYGSTYSNLISSFENNTKEVSDNTQELLKATSIIASKTGRTFEDTAERIRSGMLGSTEAIEDLGIYTQVSMLQSTEAFKELADGKSWQQLNFQTQQQIRLAAILEQTYSRYGATLADTTQTRHNQFIASLKNVQLALGQAFLPIYNAILPPLTVFMNALSKAISVISVFTNALFGKPKVAQQQVKAINNQSSAVSGLSNSLGDTSKHLNNTAKSAKKAKKEIGGLIGGLDEINNLNVNTTAGTAGTSGTSGSTPNTSIPSVSGLGDIGTIDMGSTIDTSGLDAKAKKIAAIFAKIKNIISKNKDAIIAIMAGLTAGIGFLMIKNWGKITKFFSKNFPFLTKIFSRVGKAILKPFTLIKTAIKGLLAINPVTAAITIAIVSVVSAITYLWRTNKDFRDKVIKTWNDIKDALQPWLEGFSILFKTLADIIGTVLGGAFKLISKVIIKVVEVLAGDFMNDLQKMCPSIKAVGKIFLKFCKDLQKDWKKIKNFNFKKWVDKKKKEFTDFCKGITDKFKKLKDDIKKKWDEIVDAVKEFVINITSKVEDFKEKALEKWEEVKDWIKDKALEIAAKVGSFYDKAKEGYDSANKWMKDKLLEVGAKVASFYDKAKERYNHAKTSIKNWVLSLGAKVSSFYDKAKERYESAKKSIKGWALSVGAKVGSFYDKVKSAYNSAKSKIRSWAFSISLKVKTTASSVKSTINGIIKQVNNAVLGKIKFTVPDWVPIFGGRTWKAPKIPYLAKGGLIDSPTLSVIGEQGKEVVLPLENNTRAIDLIASKLQSGMSTSDVNSFNNSSNNTPKEIYNGDFIVKLDGNTVFRQSIISILRQLKKQGIKI